jgi:hypothetical protein
MATDPGIRSLQDRPAPGYPDQPRHRRRALPRTLLGVLATCLIAACSEIAPGPAVSAITIVPAGATLRVGETLELSTSVATTAGAPTTVDWTSSRPDVASVTPTGLVEARDPGTTTITARSTFDTRRSASVAISVTPAPAIVSVTIDEGDQILDAGASIQLTVTVATTGGAPTSVDWTSSHPGVASVTPTGLVEAHAPGTTTITARSTVDPTKYDRVAVRVGAAGDGDFTCGALGGLDLGGLVLGDLATQVLVVYADAQRGSPAARERAAAAALDVARGLGGRRHAPGVGRQPDLFGFPHGRIEEALAALRARPEVAHAVRNVPLARLGAPNDPWYAAEQWNLSGFGAEAAWAVADAASPPSDPIVVAIVDDGVAIDHPDLRGAMLPGWDVVHQDDDPRNCTDHGTHVAGIAAATRGNAVGVAGVASTDWIRLLPVKVWPDGTDARATTSLDRVVAGMRWAAGLPVAGAPANATPADVLNLSLGITSADPHVHALFADVVAEIEAEGIAVVAAAGNGGTDEDGVDYPAAVATVAVGSVDATYLRSWFSTHGAGLSLMAPGGFAGTTCGVVASTGLAVESGRAWHTYACKAGTSMATPYVAGAVALLLGIEPSLRGRPDAIAHRLTAAAGLLPGGDPGEYGAGILCLDALLAPGGAVCGQAP